jgi:hypothetical protein
MALHAQHLDRSDFPASPAFSPADVQISGDATEADVSGTALRESLTSQIDVWWVRFGARLEGLADAELWWEPAPDCWTLHRADDGAFHYEWPPGSEHGLRAQDPPFTTIAWRMAHLGLAGLAGWALTFEGVVDPFDEVLRLPFPETADAATASVHDWYGRWRRAIGSLTDDDLWRPLGQSAIRTDAPAMFLGKDHPVANHVLHQHRELIHHGAEIALLRDLYRARNGRPSGAPSVPR